MAHSGKLRNMASVYLMHDNKILLLFRQGNSIVSNLWIGSAGGHFEKEELNDAKRCVLRELHEELKLNPDQIQELTLRYVSLRNMNDEIRQNYYFFAKLSPGVTTDLPSTEGITKWFSLDEISALPMPFTAKHAMEHYVTTGQFNDRLYGGIGNDSGMTFIAL